MKQERTEKTIIQICESFIKGSCNFPQVTTPTATTNEENLRTDKYIKGLSLGRLWKTKLKKKTNKKM